MRWLRITFEAALWSLIVVTTWPLLFWLGRTSHPRSELVVDPELMEDDPGEDVDE